MLPIDLPQTPGVYKIFFISPDKLYIGSTINLRKRHREHLSNLRTGIHKNAHLQRACAKYGLDTLHFEVVEHVEREEDLLEREQHYLDTLQPHYNINPSAQNSLGMKRSPETRARLSAAHKGKPLSPTQRANLVFFQEGNIPWNVGKPSWNKGRPWDEQHKQRLRTMRLGMPPPNKGKKSDKPSPRKGTHLSPEVRAIQYEKNLAYRQSRTPEQKAETLAKWRASKAANKCPPSI